MASPAGSHASQDLICLPSHAPKGYTVCLSGLSKPIMQAPCGVLAATNSVMYSGQNVQEGRRFEKTRRGQEKQQESDLLQNVLVIYV